MSTQPIHSIPLGEDRPVRDDLLGREFQEFLLHAVEAQDPVDEPPSLRAWLQLAEAWKITRTLRECRGNRSAAARALGIGRRTLYAKMEKLHISPTWAARTRALGE